MARRTQYSFERNQRARAKAAKREAKRQSRAEARADKARARATGAALPEDAVQGEVADEASGVESQNDA